MTYVITAHRSAASRLGAAVAPCKNRDGSIMAFATRALAEAKALELNQQTASPNVRYGVGGAAYPLQWQKASYGRRAYFVDVDGGRWLVDYEKATRKWRVKFSGEERAQADTARSGMDYVAVAEQRPNGGRYAELEPAR